VTNPEAVAMALAGRGGIDVARSELTRAAGGDVLVERFDRTPEGPRLMIVSAATILGLDPYLGARYATTPNSRTVFAQCRSTPVTPMNCSPASSST
jgi:hypothetical protein